MLVEIIIEAPNMLISEAFNCVYNIQKCNSIKTICVCLNIFLLEGCGDVSVINFIDELKQKRL
jgi:hypothetical protein